MDDLKFLHDNFEPEHRPEIFVVEDDASFAKIAKIYLEKSFNLNVIHFNNPDECLHYLENNEAYDQQRFFILITDISFEVQAQNNNSLETKDGLLLVDWLREKRKNFVPIVMTGFATIESAINATKKGVFHYLTKPFDLEVLRNLIVEAINSSSEQGLKGEDYLKSTEKNVIPSGGTQPFSERYRIENPTENEMFCGMIGKSLKMREVFSRIEKVSNSSSTVLIFGPSGTGKELITQAIHQLSSRQSKALVSVNCGAIPSELLESELFGHEKGAFTGAVTSRKGRFEYASEGTLFLDEIGDMPLLLQVKLLRVLQSRTIERVGGNDPIAVNVRIIAATHRDLEKAVINGDFREDLFYRLNVIPIRVPTLRERKEDIPLLIAHFLKKYASADGRNAIKFDEETFEIIMNYDWPGNVRELENLVERLVILRGGSTIRVQDLPEKFIIGTGYSKRFNDLVNLPDSGIDLKRVISDIEDSLIVQALERTQGNKNQASKLLQMNRTTLIEKIKKKSLDDLTSQY